MKYDLEIIFIVLQKVINLVKKGLEQTISNPNCLVLHCRPVL